MNEEITEKTEQDPTQSGEKLYTADQLNTVVAVAVAAALKTVDRKADKKVILRFQDECARDNLFSIGGYSVIGRSGRMMIPRDAWDSFFSAARDPLERRYLIVESGLEDDERKFFGVAYRVGEVLSPDEFSDIIGMGDKILERWPQLHWSQKEIIARAFMSAYSGSNARFAPRDLILKINQLSLQDQDKEPILRVHFGNNGMMDHLVKELKQIALSEQGF